ncbi:MAG: glycosyltransferase [Chitinophagaceae bacterium]|nr:MAG: glycosyltransferase [Chitinophagaceae bacterium]
MQELLRNLGYFTFAIYVLTALWLLLSAAMQLHLLWHYRRRRNRKWPVATGALPFVTIQLPVYNEPLVVESLLDAMAALDYPRDRFELQVLDDSTDETRHLLDRRCRELQAEGIQVELLRRPDRAHYKAGALQYGLARCRGEFIAIFDADFRPPANFLRRLLPAFRSPRVGLVQARWAHLNREENTLTRIQTFLIDTHFSVEQCGRAAAGYFINFCGTAGIWRKACIEDAGGWDGSVLSEDLDLSYRAQLRGWKLTYEPSVEVPSELPASLDAFRVQQFRWTKGMAQASRKLLHRLWSAPIAAGSKWHGTFHLLGSFLFPCLLLNALCTVPLLVFRNLFPEFLGLTNATLFTGLNLVALTLVYHAGLHSHGGRVRFWSDYPIFLLVYMALSVQNALAVLEGLTGRPSPFVRTPKGGLAPRPDAASRRVRRAEIAALIYFGCGIGLSVWLSDFFLLLFFVMISGGLTFLLTYKGSAPRRIPAARSIVARRA